MKRVYEKPEVDCQELFLFDGVADKCWAYKTGEFKVEIYYDANHNGVIDDELEEEYSVTGKSCNEVKVNAVALINQWDPTLAGKYNDADEESKDAGHIVQILYS